MPLLLVASCSYIVVMPFASSSDNAEVVKLDRAEKLLAGLGNESVRWNVPRQKRVTSKNTNKQALGTSASLLATSALLVVTRSY